MNILFTKLIEFLFFLINILLIWDRKRVIAGSRAEESENSHAMGRRPARCYRQIKNKPYPK
jgi:hypothetical protein